MAAQHDEAPADGAAEASGDTDQTPRGAAAFCSIAAVAVTSANDLTAGADAEQGLIVTAAAEINREHDLALQHAEQAVEHARRAGALLLDVKATLPRGEFIPWVQKNVTVTPRQCQRYMAAALGKPLPLRAIKSDTRVVIGTRHSAPDPVAIARRAEEFVRNRGLSGDAKDKLQRVAKIAPDLAARVIDGKLKITPAWRAARERHAQRTADWNAAREDAFAKRRASSAATAVAMPMPTGEDAAAALLRVSRDLRIVTGAHASAYSLMLLLSREQRAEIRAGLGTGAPFIRNVISTWDTFDDGRTPELTDHLESVDFHGATQ